MSEGMTPESTRATAEAFRGRYRPGKVCGLLVAGSGLSLEARGERSGRDAHIGKRVDDADRKLN